MKTGVNLNLNFHSLQNALHNPVQALPEVTTAKSGWIVYLSQSSGDNGIGFYCCIDGFWKKIARIDDIGTATLTVKSQKGTDAAVSKGTFGANATTDATITISNSDLGLDSSMVDKTWTNITDAIAAAVTSAIHYKGNVGGSTKLPTTSVTVGDMYKATADSSSDVISYESGDMIVCTGVEDSTITWTVFEKNLTGAVEYDTSLTAPTADHLTAFTGSGYKVKDSGKTLSNVAEKAVVASTAAGASNVSAVTSDPYLNVVNANGVVNSTVQLKGAKDTSISTNASGTEITISSETTKANHYTPAADASTDITTTTTTASGTAVVDGGAVVTGVTVTRDTKGHVISVDATTSTIDYPTVNDGTLTVQAEGSSVGTFSANQSAAATINITKSSLGINSNIIALTGKTGTLTYDNTLQNPTSTKHTCGTQIMSVQIRVKGEVVIADITVAPDGTIRWACDLGSGTNGVFVADDAAAIYILGVTALTA